MIGASAHGCVAAILVAWSAGGSRESDVARLGCWIALVVVVLALVAARVPKAEEQPGTRTSANSQAPASSPSAQEEPAREAFDFAAFIGEGKCEPSDIYDVSVLPHTKERIEREIMQIIAAVARSDQADYAMRWHLMLDYLAQFQVGVGEKPVGVGAFLEQFRSEPRVPGTERELVRKYLDAVAPEALTQLVESDRARYREFMHAALGTRWEQEIAAAGKMAHELLDQLGVPHEHRRGIE